MSYFPLFISLKGKKCLVVGGGARASKAVQQLLECGAHVDIVASELDDSLKKYVSKPVVHVLGESISVWQEGNPDLACYTVAASFNQQETIRSWLAEQCSRVQCHYYCDEDKEQGTAIVPESIRSQGIQLALHSENYVPAYSRYVKRVLSAFLPRKTAWWQSSAESWREKLRSQNASHLQKKQFWGQLLNSREMLSGDLEHLNHKAGHLMTSVMSITPAMGEVYLIGAGPGDPELLTLRALRLMQNSDVVLYDALVSDEVMALLPDHCKNIYVGKRKSDHAVPQDQINQLLVDYARQGNKVVRLKGGDPFIFGRGGEELELLMQNSVPFQVVPGVTAASGCSTYAGIPLTHRDYAQSVRFVTGHLKQSGGLELNWQEFIAENQTLVFYMGLSGVQTICESLVAAGKSPETGAALVEKGTTVKQRVYTSTIAELPTLVQTHDVKAPTLIIIGDVVKLHHQLNWL